MIVVTVHGYNQVHARTKENVRKLSSNIFVANLSVFTTFEAGQGGCEPLVGCLLCDANGDN